MKILILGGSKSGKSMLAQRLVRALSNGGPMYYWAAMEPGDGEDLARIERHRKEREGWGFETIERGMALEGALPLAENASVLFDSVTALLANEMFRGAEPDAGAPERALEELLAAAGSAENFVCVCDDLSRGGDGRDGWTDEYVRGLGRICRGLAKRFDIVGEVSMGLLKLHKGELPPEILFEITHGSGV